MIKLRSLICEIIAERMSYEDLMRSSDSERKDRALRIPARSLAVRSVNDREAWKFSYKTPRNEITRSPEKPNGERHQGFIYFYKETMEPGENAMKIPCSVDCSCKDYRYRFSHANKAAEAGENGPGSLNKGLNYPSSINRGPGLCKHLISLKEYLRTQIEKEPESSPQHQTIQPPQGTPVAVPASPKPGTTPPEEPEKEEPEDPQDPTQTPEPEVEPTSTPEPTEDPTETPQEPDNIEEPAPEEDSIDKEKKPLKEWEERIELFKALDEFCKKNPVFVV